MAYNRRNYILTKHVKERFVQRSNKKYLHLQWCRVDNCEECQNLKKIIRCEVDRNLKDITEEMSRRLDLADEDRSCVNNTSFMNWYYEKYGYDNRFEFLIHEDILFVVVCDNGKKFVVTCLLSRTHLAGKSHLSKHKFSKKKSPELALG